MVIEVHSDFVFLQEKTKSFTIHFVLGPMLSTMMVNAGLTTFKKIEETNPREIEMVQNFPVKCQDSAP